MSKNISQWSKKHGLSGKHCTWNDDCFSLGPCLVQWLGIYDFPGKDELSGSSQKPSRDSCVWTSALLRVTQGSLTKGNQEKVQCLFLYNTDVEIANRMTEGKVVQWILLKEWSDGGTPIVGIRVKAEILANKRSTCACIVIRDSVIFCIRILVLTIKMTPTQLVKCLSKP